MGETGVEELTGALQLLCLNEGCLPLCFFCSLICPCFLLLCLLGVALRLNAFVVCPSPQGCSDHGSDDEYKGNDTGLPEPRLVLREFFLPLLAAGLHEILDRLPASSGRSSP